MSEYEEKFLEFDRQVLTALLKTVSPHPHVHAELLLNTFEGFQQTVRASQSALTALIGDEAARLLTTIPQAVASMTRETAMKAASYILSIESAKTHLSALLNGRRNEALVIIYLDLKNRLIDESIWEGSIDRAPFYPREIVRHCALVDASAIIMAHNHPSGDAWPSETDLRVTRKLQTTLIGIDVVLIDHLIFGEGEPWSMRENGDLDHEVVIAGQVDRKESELAFRR